ncbi:acetylornithine deacetylase/succinyl-diaminopimelate desuccinylase-like protein [Bacillus mesophilus]|uniref:M20/M25/M40 family metallo-hydrolase n=1 Tax=Bacillus mesophilus TaxID=1808955 RepID=A0A6M0QAE7_9BACI|nr:M20/M25/M40 family metallo-hydrolase [Bacillus mesophilus]MBM7662137.1 acetylornithine deacetylase/succinyl-diaminopimelate desuccinylase-like protein [Bacillus mesophilus]NEY72510.1 M20/M25/M40 family metallo-hydrolase [Bacillus mesophilus]
MDFQRVLSLVEERKDEYLEMLFTLLRQKSISSQNDGVVECADLLKGMMEDIGVSTQIFKTEGQPIIYGEIMTDPSNLTILFYGHYDVQPVDPLHQWLSPPFEPTIRNGKIYCRGVGDNKGQLITHLLAIKTMLDVCGELPINVKFVFEGEEESTSVSLPVFVENHKELLKTDLVYTADGPMPVGGEPLVLLGVRGVLCVELAVKEAEWDNHSGNKGNIVPNPAWTLVELLATMRDQDQRVTIEGFYDDILPATQAELDLLKKLPYDNQKIGKEIGYDKLNMDGETYYRKLTLEPTFNIQGFVSGYGGEGSKTIIPSEAKVKVDFRLVLDQNPKDIFDKVAAHVKIHAPGVEVKFLGSMEPSRTPYGNRLVKVIEQAVEKSYNQEPIVQPSLGGSLPDYVWTKILNVPSVVVPYANFDEQNHSPNENLNLENFYNGIKCTCHVIECLGAYSKEQMKISK